ncbi:tetratricopeptide repeat protein [Falsiroseomonas sp.]|uniref:tetratricopeptide repeat protein n=1 Tax=Falsiroseomonas sp. TaxID=2870721 RepID=UPI003F6E704A
MPRAVLALAAVLPLGAVPAWAQPANLSGPEAMPSLVSCDRAAAAPHDPTRPAGVPGVPFEALDPADAPACEQAQREAPEVARLPFQLARLRERASRNAEAAALYRQAADLGHGAAARRLAQMLLRGEAGLAPSSAEALRVLRRAAQDDSPESLFALGLLHLGAYAGPFYRADSTEFDQVEGARLVRLAAGRGYAPALSHLAMLHQDGLVVSGATVVSHDEAEALRLYLLAAEGGDLFAINSVGYFHEDGLGGLARDDAAALRYYRLAAKRGDVVASYNLGRFYEEGRGGLERDDAAALGHYRLAAEGDNWFAQFKMGKFHEEGRGGLSRDRDAAVHWYRQSARINYPQAIMALRRLGVDP